MNQRSLVAATALAALVLVAGSCGVRKPPRAPQETMPEAPPQSVARPATEGGVVLHWRRPSSAVDGERLYDLAGFEIERRIGNGDYHIIATVKVDDSQRIRPQQTFSYRDPDPPAGRLRYRIHAFTDDGQRGNDTAPFGVSEATAE